MAAVTLSTRSNPAHAAVTGSLFDQPVVSRRRGQGLPGALPGCLQGDYAAMALLWMRENPRAWAYFEDKCVELARMGRHFGAKAIAEHVRFHFQLTLGEDGFKLNNSIVSYLAREVVRKHPAVAPFLEMRTAQWDRGVNAKGAKSGGGA